MPNYGRHLVALLLSVCTKSLEYRLKLLRRRICKIRLFVTNDELRRGGPKPENSNNLNLDQMFQLSASLWRLRVTGYRGGLDSSFCEERPLKERLALDNSLSFSFY